MMSIISDYLSKLKRQYPNTQAVHEQLEELRDTLHIKTEEYQSQGLNYNDAAKAAIDSLGDVTPLLEEVAGNVKRVYVTRLNRNNALFCTLIILAEFMMGWLGYALFTGNVIPLGYFSVTLLILFISISIWPIIAVIQYRKEPDRISTVEMPFRKNMRTAILGWLSISIFLFCVNWIVDGIAWFQWPVIGIATWPLNIFLYYRQLMGGRYDAV
jgi:hypothetical protein